MIKSTKPTKKKISINGRPQKVDHDVFLLIRNQSSDLSNHIAALYKYVQIYDSKKEHTDDEKVLYEYCMQIEDIVKTIEYTKEQTYEEEANNKD